MSDETTVTPDNATSKPARVKREKPATIAYSAVIAKLADKNNTDTTRAGKALRSRIRAMGDDNVSREWPAFKASQKVLRDGNRYPSHMPVAFAEKLIAGTRVK